MPIQRRQGNLGKYKDVKSKDFAGPEGTYPINSRKRAKAALSYAHYSPEASSIRAKVHKKYPDLGKAKK